MFPSSECESTKKHVELESESLRNSASLFFSRRTRPARERDARLRFGCDSHSDRRMTQKNLSSVFVEHHELLVVRGAHVPFIGVRVHQEACGTV